MRRALIVLAWGAAGLLVAGVLSVGAYAIAGNDIRQPATIFHTRTETPAAQEGSPGVRDGGDQQAGGKGDKATPTSTADDHGGASSPSSGSGSGGSSSGGSDITSSGSGSPSSSGSDSSEDSSDGGSGGEDAHEGGGDD